MKFFKFILMAILIVLAFMACLYTGQVDVVSAYVMGSDSYRIQQDSVNFGGTEDSTSASYKTRDTLGEIATGESSSASYNLHAGYRQMDEVSISISSPSDCVLSPSLGGIGGGISNCFAVWTITTDSPAGFTASLTATSTGTDGSGYVMKGNSINDYIANYTESAYNVPDYDWGGGSGFSSAAEFGYTATTTTAVDLAAAFKNSAGACNGAAMTNDQCWISASSTSRQLINRTSPAIGGTSLSVHFRVQINNHAVLQDTYVATTTVTALTL